MPRALRHALAVVARFVAGSLVDMNRIHLGSALVPAPAGADTATMGVDPAPLAARRGPGLPA